MIKFLARDAETGRIGTYQTAFTIPNLNREETAAADQLGRAQQPARAARRRALHRAEERGRAGGRIRSSTTARS